jgi:hypothetical protein
MLAPLDPRCEVVQFKSLPHPRDLDRLGEVMEGHPDVALRAYGGYDGTIEDLQFLRRFPRLTRFRADALRYQDFKSIDGLRFLSNNLVELSLGQVKRRISLRPIARFTSLRTLYLEGPWKDLDVISGLQTLEDITLRSITLPDLSILLPLRRLRSLDLKLGGTRDLSLLPELAPLAYLELWMIRGLEDISPVSELASLQSLFLQDLARIERLPDMSRMISLRRVQLQNLKTLTDLTPLLTAPALEELAVYNSNRLKPEDFECLTDHPTLRRAVVGLGSKKKNEAVDRMLNLPRPGRFVFL